MQTNMDHTDRNQESELAMGESMYRREAARQMLKNLTATNTPIRPQALEEIMDTYPIGNEV